MNGLMDTEKAPPPPSPKMPRYRSDGSAMSFRSYATSLKCVMPLFHCWNFPNRGSAFSGHYICVFRHFCCSDVSLFACPLCLSAPPCIPLVCIIALSSFRYIAIHTFHREIFVFSETLWHPKTLPYRSYIPFSLPWFSLPRFYLLIKLFIVLCWTHSLHDYREK